MDLIGKDLGKYHIIKRLGAGGMGRVYKAKHDEPARYVAIKVIQVDRQSNETQDQIKRFEREALAAAGLDHPNIVPVYEFDRVDNIYYMVMRLIEGMTLKIAFEQRQAENHPFTLVEIADIFNTLAGAVDYAHAQGIIHRDLNPSNIMLTHDNQLMLTDFGVARLTYAPGQTTIGSRLGTPAYMSPEQVNGDSIDARSDIYALGVILYELVTGHQPFVINQYLDIFKHVNKPVPPPSSHRPDLSESVEQVILKAMSKDPTDRYATASDLAQAFVEASGN